MMSHGQLYQFSKKDVHISYLPLAHIFERCIQTTIVYFGGSIGLYQGDTLKLLDDVAELKPTLFISVPRLYNRIYDKVLSGVKATGGLKAKLFEWAYASKKYWLSRGYIRHTIWDALVFGKVREKLGGRVQVMVTAAAPISADVLDFLRICFSTPVAEAYGQTETTGGATATHKTDLTSGTVGVPMPHVMVHSP
jgi:long-chain acyl-CoA synthetase